MTHCLFLSHISRYKLCTFNDLCFILKFVGKNSVKKKSLILGMDSVKSPLFSMFNVDNFVPSSKREQNLL